MSKNNSDIFSYNDSGDIDRRYFRIATAIGGIALVVGALEVGANALERKLDTMQSNITQADCEQVTGHTCHTYATTEPNSFPRPQDGTGVMSNSKETD